MTLREYFENYDRKILNENWEETFKKLTTKENPLSEKQAIGIVEGEEGIRTIRKEIEFAKKRINMYQKEIKSIPAEDKEAIKGVQKRIQVNKALIDALTNVLMEFNKKAHLL